MTTTYEQFIRSKRIESSDAGLKSIPSLSDCLFDYQKKSVEFALKKGRAALFLDTGLGKTRCQLEWAKHVPGDVLILAPLAVSEQTKREGKEIGVDVEHSRDGNHTSRIAITNYERAHLFNLARYKGVVLDESSILKSFMGKTKAWLCDSLKHVPFRLACTATPAPNDNEELGNHAEFLGQISRTEMLARWFIHDSANTSEWRLKQHAVEDFWEWVSSWAVCAGKPSDIGGDDSLHILPKLTTHTNIVKVENEDCTDGMLFRMPSMSATEIRTDKKSTIKSRVDASVKLADHNDFFICWCETNDESEALADAFGSDAVEIIGSQNQDEKEELINRFSLGQVRGVVTKPSLAGFGLNWQHCNHQIFSSISYSYEMFYQSIRRSWRFGQKRPVRIDVVMAETERPVWRSIQRKMEQHDTLKRQMQLSAAGALKISENEQKKKYQPTKKGTLPCWISKKK